MKIFTEKTLSILLVSCALLAFGFVAKMGIGAYKRHVPLEKEGNCLVTDYPSGNGTTGFLGKIVRNDIVQGFSLIKIITDEDFDIAIEVDFEYLRKQGYIKAECP